MSRPPISGKRRPLDPQLTLMLLGADPTFLLSFNVEFADLTPEKVAQSLVGLSGATGGGRRASEQLSSHILIAPVEEEFVQDAERREVREKEPDGTESQVFTIMGSTWSDE